MKKIFLTLTAFFVCYAVIMSCTKNVTPSQEQEEQQEEQEEEQEDHTWDWVKGYPVGVKVEEFTWKFTDGKKCLGFKATLDFKKNPHLVFNCTKSGGAKKKPSVFFADFAKSEKTKGTPFLAFNGGYFAGNTSVSLVISKGTAYSRAWHAINWPNDENPECTVYPVRAALGQMEDGSFDIQWTYCTNVGFAYHTAYPDVSVIGNNEKTRTFRDSAPTEDTAEFPGCFRWDPYNAIGGGPMLVKNGKNVAENSYWYECLDSGGTAALMYVNRTAAGITEDGKLIFVVCDGRGQRGSAGVTLPYLADKFIEWGCTDAVNFDGGGSSAIVGSKGKVLNSPSDPGGERAVVSAIIFTEKFDKK